MATAVFGYGSLVDPRSVAMTLGREVAEPVPASLAGWIRRFSQARDNERSEKTFAIRGTGERPPYILGMNVERRREGAAAEEPPNGALFEVTAAELDRLDLREIRYRRVDVTDSITPKTAASGFDRIVTYAARPENLTPTPPAGAVILRSYAQAIERAFARLGPGQLEAYRRTTPYPVAVVEGELVEDRIPEGNPRDW